MGPEICGPIFWRGRRQSVWQLVLLQKLFFDDAGHLRGTFPVGMADESFVRTPLEVDYCPFSPQVEFLLRAI